MPSPLIIALSVQTRFIKLLQREELKYKTPVMMIMTMCKLYFEAKQTILTVFTIVLLKIKNSYEYFHAMIFIYLLFSLGDKEINDFLKANRSPLL